MSHHTDATLMVAGTITSPADRDRLGAALRTEDDIDVDVEMPEEAGPIGKTYIYEGTYKGYMDSVLEQTLADLGLSYTWTHGATDDIERKTIVVHEGKRHAHALSIFGEPYLCASELDCPRARAALHAFLAARAAVEALPFVYAPSAHARLHLHTQKGRP